MRNYLYSLSVCISHETSKTERVDYKTLNFKTNHVACFLALLLYPTHCLLDSTIHRFLWIKFIFAHGFLKLVQFLLVGSIPSPSFPIPTTTVDEIVNLFSHSFPSVISYFNSTLFVQETSSYLHSESLRESANS